MLDAVIGEEALCIALETMKPAATRIDSVPKKIKSPPAPRHA